MSRRVQHLLAALKQVKHLGSIDKKKFLKTCYKDFIHGICECIKKHDKWSRSFEIGSVEVSQSSQADTPETCFEENIPASSQEAVTEGRLLPSSVGASDEWIRILTG